MQHTPSCLVTSAELTILQELAVGRRVLELGCWQGRSTVAMARTALRVTAVDRHRGDAYTGPADTLPLYFQHLEQEGVRELVTSIVCDFGHLMDLLQPDQFDFVFVDGAHDRDSVILDCELALNKVKVGGVIAVHDWDRWGVNDGSVRVLGAPTQVRDSIAIWNLGR